MNDGWESHSEKACKQPTVLIIDDDPTNLAMMTQFLEESHFEILIAEDGESGIKRAQYARPDLILLDILMPQIDGYETCRRLKALENTREIPVIIMTALMDNEHKIRGFQAGAVDYITKPFHREEVLARVGVHLRNRELTVMLQEEKQLLEKRVEERTCALAKQNVDLEKEMAERLRLEREIVNISEEERRRFSHELHDGLCQLLTGARLHFSMLQRKLNKSERQFPEFTQISSLLEESVNLAYSLSHGLWPVDHTAGGIIPSFQNLAHRLGKASGISIQFQQRKGCPKCENTGMTQIFRIAQEAITNAIKHAKPNRIVVELDCANRNTVTLTVCDDGVGRTGGFKEKEGLGIRIMMYRASIIGGKIVFSDGEDGGTLFTCVAPCEIFSAGASEQ